MPLDRLAVLAGRSWHASDLPGGLTNHNVRVTTTDDGPPLDLVVRCSSSDAALLDSLAKLDPTLTVPTQSAEIHATGSGATVRLNLPREAVERVASLTAARVSNQFSRSSN